jgi:hypothetical protein
MKLTLGRAPRVATRGDALLTNSPLYQMKRQSTRRYGIKSCCFNELVNGALKHIAPGGESTPGDGITQ